MSVATKCIAVALCASAVFSSAYAEDQSASPAQNQIRGIYVSGAGGLNWAQRGDATVFLGSGIDATVSTRADFDRGWAANAAIGYGWKSLFRTEIEGSYRRNELTAILLEPLASESIAGDIASWAVMANVLNDFPVNSWLSPYLGGGVGYAEVTLDATCSPTVTFCRYDDDKGGFAYQVIAGASVRLADNVQLFADYHYFGVRHLSFEAREFGDRVGDLKFRNHAAFFGIRMAFGNARA